MAKGPLYKEKASIVFHTEERYKSLIEKYCIKNGMSVSRYLHVMLTERLASLGLIKKTEE